MFMCPKAHKERKRGKVKKSKRWGSEWTRGSGCPGPRGANSSHARKIAFPYLIHWTCARWTWHVRDIPRPDTIQLQQTSSHRSHVCLHFNDILEMRRLFSFSIYSTSNLRRTTSFQFLGHLYTLFTRYNRLLNRLDVCLHDTAGWQPGWTNSQCSFNRVERTATFRSTSCHAGLYNRLYTRYSQLSNRLSNGFDNRLNVCIHDTTGCQTG